MFVKVPCLQEELYKAIRVSVYMTAYKLRALYMLEENPFFMFYQQAVSFVVVPRTSRSQGKAPEGQTKTIMFLPFRKLWTVSTYWNKSCSLPK